MPNDKPVNREAGQQQAGFRLQKLRAIEHLLKSVEDNSAALVYAAIEVEDDVNHVTSTPDSTIQLLEQDKAYAKDTSFTLNSEEVLKALSNYLVCWDAKGFGLQVSFSFYATNQCGKERSSDRLTRLSITIPAGGILMSLANRVYRTEAQIVETAKRIIIDYCDQNKCLGETLLIAVSSWGTANWVVFFDRINWMFGQGDLAAVETLLLQKISSSPLCRGKVQNGREEIILSRLVDLLDKRQTMAVPSERFIYGTDVKLTILEVCSGEYKIDDPTWRQWESIAATDNRGLEKKIEAICDRLPKSRVSTLIRKASAGILLNQSAYDNKSLLSLRYRIYDVCHEELTSFIASYSGNKISPAEFEEILSGLVETVDKKLKELARDFSYPISNTETYREIILELFDSCYLAFDEAPEAAANE